VEVNARGGGKPPIWRMKAHEPDKPRQINMIVLEDVMKMELIRGTLQLVTFAIAVLLGIIALCAVAEGGTRRKK